MTSVRIVLAALAISAATAGLADTTKTTNTSFEKCLALIQAAATNTGVAPVNIVETSILRMVRFPAADGSLLITCSKPDAKMIVQQSSKRCGVDVEC